MDVETMEQEFRMTSRDEVRKALKMMKSGEAVGSDDIER